MLLLDARSVWRLAAPAVLLACTMEGCTSTPTPAADAGVIGAMDAGDDADPGMVYLPCLEPATPGRHGDPCRCTIDCGTDMTCEDELSDGNPGGRCIRADPCATDLDCGGTAACEARRCVNPCVTNGDCRTGYLCFGTHCLPQCTDDTECEYGHCDPYAGFCLRPDEEVPGLPNFERCTNNDQCLSRLCLPFIPATPECHSACSIPAQNCPQDGVCFAASGPQNTGVCWERCTRGDVCRNPGYRCRDTPGMTGVSACRP